MISFVILHYLSYDMTVQSVDSVLQSFKNNDISVIVVDNGSANDSGKRLIQKYAGNDLVTIISNEKNLGFANGNNIGYKYAKQIKSDFIVIMNNDVIICDTDFCFKIKEIFNELNYYVLGPDINAVNEKYHQNPFRGRSFTLDEISLFHRKETRRLLIYPIQFLFDFFRYKILKQKISLQHSSCMERTINPVLHGACYIFSPLFINKRDYAFNPNTFLYLEEDILWHECQRDKMLMVYDPGLSVNHMEHVSTDCVTKYNFKRQLLKDKYLFQSSKILIDIIKSYQ